MQRFVGPRVKSILERFGMDGDEPLEHKLVTRTIEQAQTKVEGMNFDYRKHLVEYDDVLAQQRKIVYRERNQILEGDGVREMMLSLIEDEIASLVDENCASDHQDDWDTVNLYNQIATVMKVPGDLTPEAMASLTQDELTDWLVELAEHEYAERERVLGEDVVRAWERRVLLVTLSGLWIQHVDAMDELREAAMLEAFGQQDPLVAYKRKGFGMFDEFRSIFRRNVVYQIYHLLYQPHAAFILQESMQGDTDGLDDGNAPVAVAAGAPANGNGNGSGHRSAPNAVKTAQAASQHAKRSAPGKVASGKIGRNEPCYCGSGKKFKHCHGRNI
jgi:preprotein translocase subunit SecA